MRPPGQSIVEFALVFPVVLLLIAGGMEMANLMAFKAHQDRATATLAAWAAEHPGESWTSVADRELHGCDVTVTTPSRDLVEATSTCQYRGIVRIPTPLDWVTTSSRESAAVSRGSTTVASPSSSSTASPAEPSASGSLP